MAKIPAEFFRMMAKHPGLRKKVGNRQLIRTLMADKLRLDRAADVEYRAIPHGAYKDPSKNARAIESGLLRKLQAAGSEGPSGGGASDSLLSTVIRAALQTGHGLPDQLDMMTMSRMKLILEDFRRMATRRIGIDRSERDLALQPLRKVIQKLLTRQDMSRGGRPPSHFELPDRGEGFILGQSD